MVFIGAVAFSAKAVLVKLAYAYPVTPLTLLTLRMLLSLPFFLAIALWVGRSSAGARLHRGDWALIVALGLIGYYLASLLDFIGLLYISAGLERLILFTYPTLVVLLSALVYRVRIQRREALALLLTYAGIALTFVHGGLLDQRNLVLGAALIFGSALCYALYLVGCGHILPRIGATRLTAYSMVVSSIAVVVHFVLTQPLAELHLPAPVYGLGLTMALVSTVAPAFLINAGLRRIGASRAAIIASVGPVSTLLLAFVFLNETVTGLQLLGTALVLAGVTGISLAKPERKPDEV